MILAARMRSACIFSLALFLYFASSSCAWADPAGGSTANASAVAANHPVAIGASDSEVASTEVISSESVKIGKTDQQIDKSVDEDRSIASRSKPSTITRKGGESAASGAGGNRNLSWYSQSLMPLMVVLGVIGGGCLLLKRFLPSQQQQGNDLLEVVSRTTITPKHTVALIKIARRFVLVGISGERVEPICTITDPEEVADLVARTGTKSSGQSRFQDMLMGESSAYLDEVEADSTSSVRMNRQVDGAKEQLIGLLSKLKGLQSK